MRSSSGWAGNWRASSRHRTAWTRPYGWFGVGNATGGRAPWRSGCCCCPDSRWEGGWRSGRGHSCQFLLRRQPRGRSPGPANLAWCSPATKSCGSWTSPEARCGTGASRSCRRGIRRIGSCGVGTSWCSGATRRSRWTPAALPPSQGLWCGTPGSSSPLLSLTGFGSGSSTRRARKPSAAWRRFGRWRSTAGSPSLTFARPRDAGRWRPPARAVEPPDRQGPAAPAGRLSGRVPRRPARLVPPVVCAAAGHQRGDGQGDPGPSTR
jgi:hypothetical protein